LRRNISGNFPANIGSIPLHRLGADPGPRRDFIMTTLTNSLAFLRFGGHSAGGGAFLLVLVLAVAGGTVYALAQLGRANLVKQ
jgi:hypothetical protein